MAKIDSVYDFSDKTLVELKSWLEPWFLTRCPCAAGAAAANGVAIDSAYKIPGAGLQYWYRLGESGAWPTGATTTANFALDSSGNNYHLTALNYDGHSTGTIWITDPTTTWLPQRHVTGALVGGNANDGGIKFLRNDFQNIVYPLMLCYSQTSVEMEYGACPVGGGTTFSAWLGCVPVGDTSSTSGGLTNGPRWLISCLHGPPAVGVTLGFDPNTAVLTFYFYNTTGSYYTYSTPFSFVANQYYHVAVTVERLASTSYRRRIYINTNVVDEITGTAAVVGLGTQTGMYIGGSDEAGRFNNGAGLVDEVAHWQTALTASQITDLYNARVLATGDSWTAPLDGHTIADGTIPPEKLEGFPVRFATAAYTALTNDTVILANGTFTVTLYSALPYPSRKLTVKNTGSGTITLDGNASETIDGAATKTLAANAACTIVSDGNNWQLIGAYP